MSEAKSDFPNKVSVKSIRRGYIAGYIGDEACEVFPVRLSDIGHTVLVIPPVANGHVIEFKLNDYGLNMDMRHDATLFSMFMEQVKVIFCGLAFGLDYCPDTPYAIFLDDASVLLQRNF